jgi:phosphatidylethanolamine-binding protein (PEBP) family uncharacterized protein
MIEGRTPEGTLPQSAAFCLPPHTLTRPLDRRPGIRWSGDPAGTRSFVLLMIDPDVAADLSLMKKPGVTIPVDAPRMTITHWLLVDSAPDVHAIPAGAEGDGFVPWGKPIGAARYGVRGDEGASRRLRWSLPTPKRSVAAPLRLSDLCLDQATLGLNGRFFTADVPKALQDHILAAGKASANPGRRTRAAASLSPPCSR